MIGVTQVLQSYHTNRKKIDTFHLTFGLDDDSASYIDEWIASAIAMNATKISLNLKPPFAFYSSYNFPCHLLLPTRTSSLKHLHIGHCVLTPSLENCKGFNSLTTLKINRVGLSKFHLDNILSGCLNLEHLMLEECTLQQPFRISGPLPRLKSLFIFDSSGFKAVELDNLEKLETFEHIGWARQFTCHNVPALENACFSFNGNRSQDTIYLFSQFAIHLPKLKCLYFAFDPSRMFLKVCVCTCVCDYENSENLNWFYFILFSFKLHIVLYVGDCARKHGYIQSSQRIGVGWFIFLGFRSSSYRTRSKCFSCSTKISYFCKSSFTHLH